MKQKHLKPFIFFIGPVLAVILSLVTMYSLEMSLDVFYPNILGLVLGIAIVFFLTPKWGDHNIKSVYILSALSIAIFIAGFLFPGPRDVHRWISVGNVSLNIAMYILPIVLYCLHQLLHEKKQLHGIMLFASIITILSFQPDAGQATAFGLAGVVIFFRNKIHILYKFSALAIAIVTIFLAWNTVDLLDSVEYVDDIFYMIAALGPVGLAGITLVSILLFAPFIYMSFKRIETVRTLSVTFIVYLSASLIVTEFGHYPVPVFGAGASSVIGWFLMLSFVFRPY
jgi:cell division protein FtsW (lipid II flippase)